MKTSRNYTLLRLGSCPEDVLIPPNPDALQYVCPNSCANLAQSTQQGTLVVSYLFLYLFTSASGGGMSSFKNVSSALNWSCSRKPLLLVSNLGVAWKCGRSKRGRSKGTRGRQGGAGGGGRVSCCSDGRETLARARSHTVIPYCMLLCWCLPTPRREM